MGCSSGTSTKVEPCSLNSVDAVVPGGETVHAETEDVAFTAKVSLNEESEPQEQTERKAVIDNPGEKLLSPGLSPNVAVTNPLPEPSSIETQTSTHKAEESHPHKDSQKQCGPEPLSSPKAEESHKDSTKQCSSEPISSTAPAVVEGDKCDVAEQAYWEERKRKMQALLPAPKDVDRMMARDYEYGSEEHDSLVKSCVPWLIEALVAAHDSKQIKTVARELLAEPSFTLQLSLCGSWGELMAGLKEHLQQLGMPLVKHSLYYVPKLNSNILRIELSQIAAGDPQGINEGICGQARLDCQGFLSLPEWDWADPVCMWEEVWIHVIRLIALALNSQFQVDVEEKLQGAAEFSVAPIKSFTRMRNKIQAVDDHRFARRPRPSRNVDVNRTLAIVDDENAMKALCAKCSQAFGIVKVKNGFDLSPEEARNIFELRVMMLTLRYDSGRTYGQLASNADVMKLWNDYEVGEAERGIPHTRWKRHVQQALAFLRSSEIRDSRVVTMVEVQAILRPYYDVRQYMHELYKAFRAENPTQLLADFERCFPEKIKSHAERHEATDMIEAAQWNLPNAVIIFAGADPDSIDRPDVNGYTPLLIGAENGYTDVVRVLLETGAKSIDTPSPLGDTALLWCAQFGFADIAQLLLDARAQSFDTPDEKGITPLLWCAQEGFADVAKVLVDAGAKSLDTPDHCNTPLMWCAQEGFDGVAQVLIDAGAQSVNTERADHLTPLLLCADGGFLDVAMVLVRGGADLQAARQVAQKRKHKSRVDFLKKLQEIMRSDKPWFT